MSEPPHRHSAQIPGLAFATLRTVRPKELCFGGAWCNGIRGNAVGCELYWHTTCDTFQRCLCRGVACANPSPRVTMLVTLMMRPNFAARIPGSSAWVSCNAGRTFKSMTAANASGSMAPMVSCLARPTLLTIPSMFPRAIRSSARANLRANF
jgi:hypothetical protein